MMVGASKGAPSVRRFRARRGMRMRRRFSMVDPWYLGAGGQRGNLASVWPPPGAWICGGAIWGFAFLFPGLVP